MRVLARRNATRWAAIAVLAACGAAMLPVGSETTAAPSGGSDPAHHLGIALDARSFISAEDFERQKVAVANLILDSRAIPRNGSVALAVVALWPDGSLGVPQQWPVLSSAVGSEGEAQAMAQAVLDLEQAPYDGAADIDTFAVSGMQTTGYDYETFEIADTEIGISSVCQILFAPPSATLPINAGWSVTGGSVDRIDFIGVGGYGNTGATTTEVQADNLAFGGTGYTYIPYAQMLGATLRSKCLADIPKVVGMEVNQSIQNLDGTVPLIAGKDTAVRVFAERLRPASSTAFDARLKVTRTLPGSASIQSRILAPVTPSREIYLPLDYRPVRDNTGSRNQVLEFRIPPAWTVEGELQLELVSKDLMTCAWEHTAVLDLPRYCGKTVTFVPGPEITVVAYRLLMNGFPQPTHQEVAEQMRRLESAMPVGDARVIVRGGYFGADNGSPMQVNAALWAARAIESSAPWRFEYASYFYYGFANKPGKAGPPKIDSHRGLGFMGVGTSSINSSDREAAPYTPGTWRNVFAHEIGHAAGLPHVLSEPTASSRSYSLSGSNPASAIVTLWKDSCGAEALVPGGSTPYWYFTVTQPGTVNGVDRPVNYPVISAFAGAGSNFDFSHDYEFWGVEPRFLGQAPRLAVHDPRITGELMSYVNSRSCTLVDAPDRVPSRDPNLRTRYWPSMPTYETLKYILLNQDSFGPISGVALPTPVVWGFLSPSSDPEVGPLLDLPGQVITGGNSYGIVLRTYDAEGNFLSESAPQVGLASDAPGEDPIEDEGEPGAFFVARLEPGDIHRVDLVVDDEIVYSTGASEHEPVVAILEPTPGATAAADSLQVSWQGDDGDGDELRYSVLFSPDGEAWQMLANRIDATQFDMPTNEVPATESGIIKVIVDDGFLSSEATVDHIVVPEHAPEVIVAEPFPGQVFAPGDYIGLRAYVFDVDEGPLPDDDVVWSSDADGVLDFDPLVGLRSTDLTPGPRVLTATVVDAEGNTGQHAIAVLVDDPSLDPSTPAGGAPGTSGGAAPEATPDPSPTGVPSPSPTPGSGAAAGEEPTSTSTPTQMAEPVTPAPTSGAAGIPTWLAMLGGVVVLTLLVLGLTYWVRWRRV